MIMIVFGHKYQRMVKIDIRKFSIRTRIFFSRKRNKGKETEQRKYGNMEERKKKKERNKRDNR